MEVGYKMELWEFKFNEIGKYFTSLYCLQKCLVYQALAETKDDLCLCNVTQDKLWEFKFSEIGKGA